MRTNLRHAAVGSCGWYSSYSRKGYSEAVLRQDTDTFLRCLENGLRSFGGVPLLLNPTTTTSISPAPICEATHIIWRGGMEQRFMGHRSS
jgi:transposase